MKVKTETSVVMIVIYSAMVNLEGRVKQRKDLRTVTDNI